MGSGRARSPHSASGGPRSRPRASAGRWAGGSRPRPSLGWLALGISALIAATACSPAGDPAGTTQPPPDEAPTIATAEPDAAVEITLPTGASISIPAGAVAESTPISLTEVAGTRPEFGEASWEIVGSGYDFDAADTHFAIPVTLTIPYDETLLPDGYRETELVLAAQHGDEWIPVFGQVDTDANTITVDTIRNGIWFVVVLPFLVLAHEPTRERIVDGFGNLIGWFQDAVDSCDIYQEIDTIEEAIALVEQREQEAKEAFDRAEARLEAAEFALGYSHVVGAAGRPWTMTQRTATEITIGQYGKLLDISDVGFIKVKQVDAIRTAATKTNYALWIGTAALELEALRATSAAMFALYRLEEANAILWLRTHEGAEVIPPEHVRAIGRCGGILPDPMEAIAELGVEGARPDPTAVDLAPHITEYTEEPDVIYVDLDEDGTEEIVVAWSNVPDMIACGTSSLKILAYDEATVSWQVVFDRTEPPDPDSPVTNKGASVHVVDLDGPESSGLQVAWLVDGPGCPASRAAADPFVIEWDGTATATWEPPGLTPPPGDVAEFYLGIAEVHGRLPKMIHFVHRPGDGGVPSSCVVAFYGSSGQGLEAVLVTEPLDCEQALQLTSPDDVEPAAACADVAPPLDFVAEGAVALDYRNLEFEVPVSYLADVPVRDGHCGYEWSYRFDFNTAFVAVERLTDDPEFECRWLDFDALQRRECPGYPGGPVTFDVFGIDELYIRWEIPQPGTATAQPPPPAEPDDIHVPACPSAATGPCFDFALDSISIDGNIGGAGEPDGRPDVFDEFDDGELLTGPTAAFEFGQGPEVTAERDGYLHLTSLDGAYSVGGDSRDDLLTRDHLTQGGGDCVITANFFAHNPGPGQLYSLGVAGVSKSTESVRIIVAHRPGGATIFADEFHTGRLLGSFDVDLAAAERLTLRLEISDGAVMASYRVDQNPLRTFPESGRMFIEDPAAFVFVFGNAI